MRFLIYVPADIEDIYPEVQYALRENKIQTPTIEAGDWIKKYKDGRETKMGVYRFDCRCSLPRYLWFVHKYSLTRLKSEIFIEQDVPCYTL